MALWLVNSPAQGAVSSISLSGRRQHRRLHQRPRSAADAHVFGLFVITLAGDKVSAITRFDNSVIGRFGLPLTLHDRIGGRDQRSHSDRLLVAGGRGAFVDEPAPPESPNVRGDGAVSEDERIVVAVDIPAPPMLDAPDRESLEVLRGSDADAGSSSADISSGRTGGPFRQL